MTWVYFEENDRQTAAPAFSLESNGVGRMSLHDFYDRSCLVLLFPPDKPDALGALERFSDRLDEIERQGAQIVAVLPDKEETTDQPGEESSLGYVLLTDPAGRVWVQYAGLMVPEGSPLLYVLDVYGAPWAAYVAENLDEDGLIDEVVS